MPFGSQAQRRAVFAQMGAQKEGGGRPSVRRPMPGRKKVLRKGKPVNPGAIASALTGGPMIAAMRQQVIDRARLKAAETAGGAPPGGGGGGGGKMMPNMGQSESAAPKKKSVTQEVSAGIKEKLKKPTPKTLKAKIPKVKTAKITEAKIQKPQTVTRYK